MKKTNQNYRQGRHLALVLAVLAGFTAFGTMGCGNGATIPDSKPVPLADQIKAVQNDPNLPPDAKQRVIGMITAHSQQPVPKAK